MKYPGSHVEQAPILLQLRQSKGQQREFAS